MSNLASQLEKITMAHAFLECVNQLLTVASSLADFDERTAGVERQFQRELEAAREELLVARAWYTVTKQMLATLAGYRHDCQAFLAWQEENNVGEGDWEEAEAMEVPEDDADLDA
ncbi:hypothetical protein E4T56_gene6169 [Termitomyces sp. T112]|nr:hypothetical protein E4T56_gene6169 [Termitomyces sp. T112]